MDTIPNARDVMRLFEKSRVVSRVYEKKGNDVGIVVIRLLAKISTVVVAGMLEQLTTASERDEQLTVVPVTTHVLVLHAGGGVGV